MNASNVIYLLPAICLFACGLSLVFENKNLPALSLKAKVLASLSVVGLAWSLGAMDSSYGQLLLTGLILSLVGDVLLGLNKQKHAFISGVGAFLLAHLFYALAFFQLGFATAQLPLLLPVILIMMVIIALWLRAHLIGVFKIAIPMYLMGIGTMLVFAWGNQSSTAWWPVVTGASLFAISDLFVARNRFIKPAFINRIIGLPIYYVAQLMLAYSLKELLLI